MFAYRQVPGVAYGCKPKRRIQACDVIAVLMVVAIVMTPILCLWAVGAHYSPTSRAADAWRFVFRSEP